MTPQKSNNSLNFTHVFFHSTSSTCCMAMFVLSVFQYPTDSNGLYPGLISDVEFAINDDGSVQVRSALRSMAPDASLCSTAQWRWFFSTGWILPSILKQTWRKWFRILRLLPPKRTNVPWRIAVGMRLENDFPFEIASFLGDMFVRFRKGWYKLMIFVDYRFFLQPFRFTWTVSLSACHCEHVRIVKTLRIET